GALRAVGYLKRSPDQRLLEVDVNTGLAGGLLQLGDARLAGRQIAFQFGDSVGPVARLRPLVRGQPGERQDQDRRDRPKPDGRGAATLARGFQIDRSTGRVEDTVA